MKEYKIVGEHLTKQYKNRKVVNDVSMHVVNGEIYGLVGPNGAGKSTMLKMLLNLTKPDMGEFTIDGVSVQKNGYQTLRKVGAIIENPYFYEQLTGRENLELHCEYMGYGYLNKIRSSRALETEAKRNLELMWLINCITPDHGTIAGFVQKNKAAFHNTLRNLTLILKGWGLIDGELIVIDGTKIRAQNSKHNCITQSGLDKKIEYAEAQINAYLMAIVKDEALADDLTDKLKTYQELKEQYLTQKQELKDKGLEQKSLTDPDSRRMKNNGSLDICYNVQSVVDAKNHFVVDISTTNDINDQNQLYTMAQKASELLEKESSTVLADTGYYNGTEIKNCVDAGMNVFIKKAKANNATKDNEFRKEKFIYNGETDEYICPAGDRLRFFENTSKNGMKYRKYKCTDCNSCKYKKDCTTSSSGRTIQRWVYEDVLETVYNETLNNNEVYKQRRCIVEHPFGTIKRSLGYSFFLRRRQENVDAEAASMFIAYNFKRLLNMFSTEELVTKFEESVM